jgi:hypothetical protein
VGEDPKVGAVLKTNSTQLPAARSKKSVKRAPSEKPSDVTPSDLPPAQGAAGPRTRAEAEQLAKELQGIKEQLDVDVSKRDQLVLAHEAKLKLPEELRERIDRNEARLLLGQAYLERWAGENRKEFAGKQSLELVPGAELSFHLGNPKVDVIEEHDDPTEPIEQGKKPAVWGFSRALAAMLRNLRRWKRYVVRKPTLSKERILEDVAIVDKDKGKGKKPKLTNEDLKDVGLKVTRDENFSSTILSATELRTLKASDQKP